MTTRVKRTAAKDARPPSAPATTPAPMIWPEKLRAQLRPRRRPGEPPPNVPPGKRINPRKFWEEIYYAFRSQSFSYQWTVERAPADARPLMEQALAAFTSPEPVVAHAPPELEAAIRHLSKPDLLKEDRWIRLWAQRRGVVFALEALLAYWQLDTETEIWPGPTPAWLVRRPIHEDRFNTHFVNPLPACVLRDLLAGSDEETYQRGLAIAGAARDGAPFHLRAGIAILFPTEAAWVDESCREALALHRPVWHRAYTLTLLESTTNLELARAMAARIDRHRLPLVGAELVETFGPRLLDLLIDAFNTPDWAYKEDRVELAWVISVFGEPTVVPIMLKCLESQYLREVGRDFCMRFPDLMRPALERLAAKKTKASAIAAEILAALPS